MKRHLVLISILWLWAGKAPAALRTETVEYTDSGIWAETETGMVKHRQAPVPCEGYLAYDDSFKGKRPGVIVVHEWMGLGPYAKRRADQLAKLGYVAFAVDIYGKGVRAKDMQDAARLSSIYKDNRKMLRGRAFAGLEVLKKNPRVDSKRLAAIGYCFGGTTVLEMARSGADISGVVSFHGGLDSPTPDDAKNIKGKVLALHGADDPYVTAEIVSKFEEEMRKAGVDWQLVKFGGAVHGFTMQEAGTDPSKGMAYNEAADKRSWQMMKDFFNEIFKSAP